MIRKTWHKQLHRRKIWKSYTLPEKIWYYMEPLIMHLIMVWLQPLPVPTILKVIGSACLLVFILFPVIYPGAILLATYWVCQFIAERDFGVQFPQQLDFHSYIQKLIDEDPAGEYRYAVYYYCQRFKVLAATFVSLIDYIRLATSTIAGI